MRELGSRIEDLCNEYIKQDEKYKKDVELFVKYVIRIGKDNKPTDITKDDLTESVKYYNQIRKIGTQNTLQRYISAIKALYKFFVDERLQEDLFAKYYITSIGDYIKELCSLEEINFAEISKREALPDEVLSDLLDKLDSYDYEALLELNPQQRDWYYKYKMLRIFIKTMLIAPVKKNKITNLKLVDINLVNRTVLLNGYYFEIPNGLYRDYNDYLKVRNKYNMENNIEDDYLFMHSNKTNKITDSELNVWFGEFLHENDIMDIEGVYKNNWCRYTCTIEPIMNSALYNMIKNGTNLEIIAKINNCTVATIAEKFHIKLKDDESINKLISNEIKKNFYYKYI